MSFVLDWEMDFHGQQLSERIAHILIIAGMAIGTIVGFLKHDIQLSWIIWGASTILTLIVCIPPWPFYNRHPVKWRPAKFMKKAAVKPVPSFSPEESDSDAKKTK